MSATMTIFWDLIEEDNGKSENKMKVHSGVQSDIFKTQVAKM